MGRTKQFDPDTAVDGAMRLFWEKGYEATSLSELCERLGIGRASFYDTFGSKRQLYAMAIDHYSQGGQGLTPLEVLSRPGRAIDAVRALIHLYADHQPVDDNPRGCLIVNAAVECDPNDDVIAGRLSANRDGMEAVLTATLLRARAEGDLDADADPTTLARFLLVLFNGMSVAARTGEPTTRTADAARIALAALT